LEWSVNLKQTPLPKPWFFENGTIKASQRYSSKLAIWPEEVELNSLDVNSDRIINQLMYVPHGKLAYKTTLSNPHN